MTEKNALGKPEVDYDEVDFESTTARALAAAAQDWADGLRVHGDELEAIRLQVYAGRVIALSYEYASGKNEGSSV